MNLTVGGVQSCSTKPSKLFNLGLPGWPSGAQASTERALSLAELSPGSQASDNRKA